MPTHHPQMLKGVLDLLLLATLAAADSYGYALVVALRSKGFDDLAEGSIYPALTRLENSGHLESYLLRSASGPARKYYRLTPQGRAELTDRQRAWSDLVTSVENTLAIATDPPQRPLGDAS